MQFLAKLLAANVIIVACARIGGKSPTLAGLIATMPLTSLLVMLWLYSDSPGNFRVMTDYARGVLWGIIPTVLFFVVSLVFFRRQLPLALTLSAAFAAWFTGAVVHQLLLK